MEKFSENYHWLSFPSISFKNPVTHDKIMFFFSFLLEKDRNTQDCCKTLSLTRLIKIGVQLSHTGDFYIVASNSILILAQYLHIFSAHRCYHILFNNIKQRGIRSLQRPQVKQQGHYCAYTGDHFHLCLKRVCQKHSAVLQRRHPFVRGSLV